MNEFTRTHAPVQDYGFLVYSDVSVSTSEWWWQPATQPTWEELRLAP